MTREQADGDLISRSRMLADLKENYEFMTVDGYADLFNDFIEFIKRQPSVAIPSAEPCEDAISRQAVLDLIDADWKYEGLETYVADLPPVKPQEPKADNDLDMKLKLMEANINGYTQGLKDASNTEQESKTGHWIRWYEQKETEWYIDNIPHCKCSECGKEYDPHSSQFIKYCNECGAKMVEPQERSE